MPLIAVPTELRKRLGEVESEQLLYLLEKAQKEQRDHLFELLEERFHRKIESEIHALRTEFKEDMASLRKEMQKQFGEVQKQFGEVQKQFGEVQKQFSEMHKQLAGIQKQITRQSQWMIGLIGFLAIALKLLDLIFQ